MFGFESEYALGTDIFSLKKNEENIVILPDASFITDKVYYDSQSGDYFDLTKYKNLSTVVSCNQVYKDYVSPVYSEERDGAFKSTAGDYSEENMTALINDGVVDDEYIQYYSDYAEKRIEVSNAIIYHDLIREQENPPTEENAS